MHQKIWRNLIQILYYRNDLADIMRPFFENLKNENIKETKYIPFLRTFSINQLEVLYKKKIIGEIQPFSQGNVNGSQIEEIISGDKITELDKLLQEKDIKTLNTITKSFLEVEEMQIPLIQYCIMKNAIECFKYLLVNGFDDPNKTMQEQNPEFFYDSSYNKIEIKRYEWDCMATAIYFGNKEIIKILEEKGIEKGKNASHFEAAILSYRNMIAKEIIEDLNENNEQIQNILNISIIALAKNNNIKEIEFLMTQGVKINAIDIIYLNIKILFLIKII